MLRVAISGSGSAGPTAAIMLAQAGHEVTLFERAPEPLPVGAGFLLQPTGMAVLKKIGVLDELLTHTARVQRLYCQNHNKTTLLDLSYAELDPTFFGAGTHRASLLDILIRNAEKSGVTMRWNHSIQGLQREKALPILIDQRGEKHGPYDLVLICDGSRSTLREYTGIPTQVDRYPWGALWFIGKRTAEFDPHTLWQAVHGTRHLTGFLPTGTPEDLLSLFWSIRMDELEHWKHQPVSVIKDQILKLAPQAEPFLDQLKDSSQLQSASYYDVRMNHWHAPNIALLGDAAHALSPQLGQGVNLALVDASTLVDCINEFTLEAALPEYSRRRKAHLAFYQFATRWCTPFFQSDFFPLGQLRDLSLPLAMTLPWGRRQMTATMAGLKTGPFSQLNL